MASCDPLSLSHDMQKLHERLDKLKDQVPDDSWKPHLQRALFPAIKVLIGGFASLQGVDELHKVTASINQFADDFMQAQTFQEFEKHWQSNHTTTTSYSILGIPILKTVTIEDLCPNHVLPTPQEREKTIEQMKKNVNQKISEAFDLTAAQQLYLAASTIVEILVAFLAVAEITRKAHTIETELDELSADLQVCATRLQEVQAIIQPEAREKKLRLIMNKLNSITSRLKDIKMSVEKIKIQAEAEQKSRIISGLGAVAQMGVGVVNLSSFWNVASTYARGTYIFNIGTLATAVGSNILMYKELSADLEMFDKQLKRISELKKKLNQLLNDMETEDDGVE